METSQVSVYRFGRDAVDYRACFHGSGRVSRLTRFIHGPISVDAIAGRFVAFRLTDTHYDRVDNELIYVEVLDARSGRLRLKVNALGGPAFPPPTVTPVQLLSDGTVAWIARDESDGTGNWYVNLARPRTSSAEHLDVSPSIEPDSLALTRGYVYWTKDGQAQSRRV